MGVYRLAGIGILCAGLLALNNLIKTLLRREQIGFVDTLLAFMTTLVPLAALIVTQTSDAPDAHLAQAARLTGAALAVFSIVLLILEVFRPQRLKGSRGILGLYVGLLLLIASVGVPFASTYFAPPSLALPTSAVALAVTPSSTEPTIRKRAQATPTETPSLAPTNTPRPTATASPTRFVFSTRTPTPTPSLPTPCVASVLYNLRLRAAPDRSAETLLVIPYGTTVELYARGPASTGTPGAENASWWYTAYQGNQGWLDGQYLLVSAACDSLPTRETP